MWYPEILFADKVKTFQLLKLKLMEDMIKVIFWYRIGKKYWNWKQPLDDYFFRLLIDWQETLQWFTIELSR